MSCAGAACSVSLEWPCFIFSDHSTHLHFCVSKGAVLVQDTGSPDGGERTLLEK